MNFLYDYFLYVGNYWSEGFFNGVLDNVDVVFVLDCDVLWIKLVFWLLLFVMVYYIDCDLFKVKMLLFYVDVELVCQVDM